MKTKTLLSGLFLALTLNACIQDEALNIEAAIDGCTGAQIQSITIDYQAKEVEIYILDGTDMSGVELNFTLPEGATIAPLEANAKDQPPYYDFSDTNIRQFTVTAEDGMTNVTYRIRINEIKLPTEYSFESLKNKNPYHVMYLTNESGIMEWASGNPGYELTGMGFTPADYPTTQMDEGVNGKAVRLETKDTGSFGTMVGMRIAAGNLFIGSFDRVNAVNEPLEATRFGYPFTQMPIRMTGYYKYTSGGNKSDAEGNPMDEPDCGDIYAVLYKAPTYDYTLDGDLFPQDGSINPNIVLMARISETKETEDWTFFDLPFETIGNNTVDRTALANGNYKLAVVFSSSIDGAYFIGATGSTLCIDEVKIICEED